MDFVIIRATFGRFGTDKKFIQNVEGCLKNEIPFGLYYYSYALTEKEAEEEVNHFHEVVKNYKEKMCFPAIIDMEDSDKYKFNHGVCSKEELTNICKTACEELIKKGYQSMIYANADWFKNKLIKQNLKSYFKWLACWNEKENAEELAKEYIIWQYSSKGKVNGISGNVDLNYSFIDFKKLNTYVENVSKLNFIKFTSNLSDFDLQFISSYKYGQDLVNKIHKRLLEPKTERKLNPDLMKEVQKEFKLELKTMQFIYMYVNCASFINKLYNAVTKEVDNNTENN